MLVKCLILPSLIVLKPLLEEVGGQTQQARSSGDARRARPTNALQKPRNFLSDLIIGQTDRIQEALDEVFECNKKEYQNVMFRLISYVMPKATEVESEEAESSRKPLSWFGESIDRGAHVTKTS